MVQKRDRRYGGQIYPGGTDARRARQRPLRSRARLLASQKLPPRQEQRPSKAMGELLRREKLTGGSRATSPGRGGGGGLIKCWQCDYYVVKGVDRFFASDRSITASDGMNCIFWTPFWAFPCPGSISGQASNWSQPGPGALDFGCASDER